MRVLSALFALLFFLPACASAFAEPTVGEADAALRALEQKTQGLRSLRADFEQISHIPLFDAPVTSTGRLLFQKPGNLLWGYTAPYAEGFAFYNEKGLAWDERAGVRQLRPDQEPAVRSFRAGISGWVEFSVATVREAYDVSVLSVSPLVLKLVPKDATLASVVASMVFTFADDGTARTLVLQEASGGKTEIRFHNVVVNAPLTEADFTRPTR